MTALEASANNPYHVIVFIKLGAAGLSISTILIVSFYLQCLSHTLMISTSLQSIYFQRQMNEHFLKMTESFGKATYHQLSGNEYHAEALEYRSKAIKDAELGENKIHESIVLKEKSKKDELRATIFEETAEFLDEKSSVEAEKSASHASIAVEEEILYDTLRTESIAESELAVRDEELAYEDIEAVAACEFVPLLDMVCDVIGGVAEVGLHVKAIEDAALAGEDYITATNVKLEEEVEEALSTAYKAKSIEDATRAGEYEFKAGEELEEAKIEKAAALKMREDGEIELTKSAEENSISMTEEAKAEEEGSLSLKAFDEAMLSGSYALIDDQR